jgi:threonine dehydrogenase-like Zn-dependent dehydrogenase
MKAIAIVPGTTTLRLVDRPEPSIAAPDEVKVQVLRVGICGTDREEVAGDWPQNMWLDGRSYWGGVQMDETAFPILLISLACVRGRCKETT